MNDNDFEELIKELNQHPDMIYVWNEVDKPTFFKSSLIPVNYNREIFKSLLSLSLTNKNKTECYTESEFKEWEGKILKSAKDLIKLLGNSYINSSSFIQESIDSGDSKVILSSIGKSYVKVLEKLITDVPKERVESIRSKRPNDPKNLQTYFMKKLSKNLLFYTGKKHLKIIAILTSIVFDLSSTVTESQVSRVLKVNS